MTREPTTYKITRKDGTIDFYFWEYNICSTIDKETTSFEPAEYWLPVIPDGSKQLDEKDIDKIEEVYNNREIFKEFTDYMNNYYRRCEEERKFIIFPQREENNPQLKEFNDWLTSAATQRMLNNWLHPTYGYSDITVEDLSMILMHTWEAARGIKSLY